jgi:hypothetical protein
MRWFMVDAGDREGAVWAPAGDARQGVPVLRRREGRPAGRRHHPRELRRGGSPAGADDPGDQRHRQRSRHHQLLREVGRLAIGSLLLKISTLKMASELCNVCRYDVALDVNVMGVKHMCQLARQCPNLEVILHVSTGKEVPDS